MTVDRRLGRLPVEIWQMAFDHLDQSDLFSLRGVNSSIDSIARPLLYRYGQFTRLGLHFPGAPNLYPFTSLPELNQVALEAAELDKLARNLRRIEIQPHKNESCSTVFKGLWPKAVQLAADVLWFAVEHAPEERLQAWAKPAFPGCFVHTDYWHSTLRTEGHPGASDENAPIDTACLKTCSYLDEPDLWSIKVRKVVIREAYVALKKEQR